CLCGDYAPHYRILTMRHLWPYAPRSNRRPFTMRPFQWAAALLAVLAFASSAQEYPSKPIRIIAPFPAGTGPDANAREIAAELTKVLGQTVFVENRPGASSIIGMEAAAKSAPDGYTLVIGTASSLSV